MSVPPAPTPLRRRRDDRVLGGVCAGIARQLNVDPLLVRILAVVVSLIAGAGVLAYVIAMLIIPEEGQDEPLLRKAVDGQDRSLVVGLVIVGLVVWAVAAGGHHWFWGVGWGFGWLIAAGILVLLWVRRDERRRGAGVPAGAAPGPSTPAPGVPDASRGDATASTTHPNATAATAVADAVGLPGDAADATLEYAAPTVSAPPRRRRTGGRIALGATLVAIGAIGAIGTLAGDGVRWDILLASSVIVVGAVLVASAPFGGARALIPLGLVLAGVTGVAAAADLDLRGGAGDRVIRPQNAAELKTDYHLAAGHMELDLRDVELPDGTTKVHPEMGFGALVVRVPETARVQVDAHVSGGRVEALGRDGDGFDTDVHVEPTPGAGPVVAIDAKVGFGYISVVRGNEKVGHGYGSGH